MEVRRAVVRWESREIFLLGVSTCSGLFFFVSARAWERSGPLREEGDGQSSE